VTPAPPPPHERTWRHPSEVALGHRTALKSERPTHRIRRVGTLSVAVGFITVGLALVSVAPGSAPDLTTTPLARTKVIPLATPVNAVAEINELFGLDKTYRGNLAVASDHQVTIALTDNHAAAATDTTATELIAESSSTHGSPTRPITMSSSSSGPSPSRLEVRLEDGTRTGARVIASRAGVALIELDQHLGPRSRSLATSAPDVKDVVVLLTERPQRLTYGQLLQMVTRGGSVLAGGTPVVSIDGVLLGICVEDTQGGNTRFITAAELAAASGP
jgi:hypothetical protein